MQKQYINGHFCYIDKFAILTNGLGIIKYTIFLEDDFKAAHPEMTVEKNRIILMRINPLAILLHWNLYLLIFSLHPDFQPNLFLGDSSLDIIETYGMFVAE